MIDDAGYRWGEYMLTQSAEADVFWKDRGIVPDGCPFKMNPHWYTYNEELGKWMKRIPTAEEIEIKQQRYSSVVELFPDEQSPISGEYIPCEEDEKLNFVESLEKAFHQVGGVGFLVRIARSEPLEFMKICAKLIPVHIKSIESDNTVSVTVNQLPLESGDVE